jgi:GTP-binding protein
MQFLDEAKIFVRSGNGGAGCVSFRREANIPFGGPDGGNGGRGGHIIVRATRNLNTLIDFRYKQHFKAKTGMHGMGKQRDGIKGEDVLLTVPVGTQIYEEDGITLLADFTDDGQEIILAKGGGGGLGNVNFKTSTNQAPRKATAGELGEEKWIWLRLKLLCDVGLVGLPNAGKSTFLAATTRAKPKIADYPFTTLKPQLGMAYINQSELLLADIPGLIEGAHEGVGLGTRFLKHIERCGAILHVIDATQEDVAGTYQLIRAELEHYSDVLAQKHEIIALNKCDALTEEAIAEKCAELATCSASRIFPISAVAHTNLPPLLNALWEMVHPHEEDMTE